MHLGSMNNFFHDSTTKGSSATRRRISDKVLAHCTLAPLGTCRSTGTCKSIICAREGKAELPKHWERSEEVLEGIAEEVVED